MKLLDCTLKDRGYYNATDFSHPLMLAYLEVMPAADPRNLEMVYLLKAYQQHPQMRSLTTVTPSHFRLEQASIYGFCAQPEVAHV